jgi:hypothetical protein
MPSPEFLPNPSKKSHLKPFCRKRKNRLGGVACGLSLDTLGANFGLRRPIFPLLRGIRVGCLAGDAHGIEPDVAVLLGNDETPSIAKRVVDYNTFYDIKLDKGLHQKGNGLRIHTIRY